MADMVPAGMAVAAGAALCFESAYLLQALEARRVAPPRTAVGALAPLIRRSRWLAGLSLSLIGAALQVYALHLAPITAVQPTLALGIVALVLVGGRLLGEPAGAADVGAAAVLAAGITLLGFAGSGVHRDPIHPAAAVATLAVLGVVLAVAVLRPQASPAWLVAGAGAGDAIAALAAARLSDALAPVSATALVWVALGVVSVTASLSAEMAALARWPATRVGPFVLVCQTAIPILLAPFVIGEDWTPRAPLVLAGLALTSAGAWRLAASGGLRERGKALEQDVGGGG